jgi:potassium channel subfamily K
MLSAGPLANVLSIAALVTYWRVEWNADDVDRVEGDAVPFRDPSWCLALNAVSLVCGVVGNAFLLANFTRRVRYIIALPVTIIMWYVATGILVGITASMQIYDPPQPPLQIYSQGFWHAIIAAVLYLVSSMLLMVNMLGYFLGHYPQHFDLTDEQRNLILQSMMFFVWLAGGAGMFYRVTGWSYPDALYFCDVTILTVGFGDYAAPNDVGRGLVFPYSVGGIIMLGLLISSIQRFATELGQDKIVKNVVETRRQRTVERALTSSRERPGHDALEASEAVRELEHGLRPIISSPFNPEQRTISFNDEPDNTSRQNDSQKGAQRTEGGSRSLRKRFSWRPNDEKQDRSIKRAISRRTRLLLLREEKDRFDAMRAIQYSTRRFKRYFALSMSVTAFGILWCVGAVVFWCAEQHTQDLTYFQALYFCYVSLLTIGYGDLAPKSNAGKPFFIVWSLVAVPTMTILVSDMGNTVVASYKRGTFKLADWTVLLKADFFEDFKKRHHKVFSRFENWRSNQARKKRLRAGFPAGPDTAESHGAGTPTLEELADDRMDEPEMARRLMAAIRRIADHLKNTERKRYTYEEWAEYTRLIRFTRVGEPGETWGWNDDEHGIVDWDWIGPNSPMMSDQSETEWLLDRLCESMARWVNGQTKSAASIGSNNRNRANSEKDEADAGALG